MPDAPLKHPVRVWDLPTRCFHWLLAASVVGCVLSAKIGGNAMVWHQRLGLLVLALLAFRLVWGFLGGHWSRWRSLIYPPSAVLRYLRGEEEPKGPQVRWSVGHSPLGVLSVWAMLLMLAAQVATGLVADDEIATTGPLYRFVSSATALQATSWHTGWGQWLIVALVLLHIAAIAFYFFFRGNNLVGPMWHGDKQLTEAVQASADGVRQHLLAAIFAALASALAFWIAGLATP
jgi:cytochrome b